MLIIFILLCPLFLWANEEMTIELPGGESIEMVRIEAGTFKMGTPREQIEEWRRINKEQREIYPTSHKEIPYSNETPQHEVTLSKSFYLGKYEVSRDQWFAVMDPEKDVSQPTTPMSHISWLDVQEYIVVLNEQTGLSFRLPTEAEWEYSARAGTTTLWWTGDDEKEAENIIKNTVQPNPWGLVKMLGGVMEFTSHMNRTYEDQHEIDPVGPDPREAFGSDIILRGGDDGRYAYVAEWYEAFPGYARCAYRMYNNIHHSGVFWVGFRLLLEEDSLTTIQPQESWGKIKKRVTP